MKNYTSLQKNIKKSKKKQIYGDFIRISLRDMNSLNDFSKKIINFINMCKILNYNFLVFSIDLEELFDYDHKTPIKTIKEFKKIINKEINNRKLDGGTLALIFKTDLKKNKEEQKNNKKIIFEYYKKLKDYFLIYDCKFGFDRDVFERIKPNLIVNIELDLNKLSRDFIHQRNSGMNEAIVGFMKKHEINYGISFYDLQKENKKFMDFNLILGKYYQNIKLIKDYNINFNIFSFANEPKNMKPQNELKSFLKLLSFDTKSIKNSLLIEIS